MNKNCFPSTRSLTIIGMQWGDEGKGKIVDHLAERANTVVRFQGGHNAGHTLMIDGKKIVLHVLPTGMARHGICNYIGNGVVLSLSDLDAELNELIQGAAKCSDQLFLSHRCMLILSIHKKLDQVREQDKKAVVIGTTGKGIGPAYEDKVSRRGLKLGELLYDEKAYDRMKALYDYHNFILKHYYSQPQEDFEREWALQKGLAEKFKDQVVDVEAHLQKRIERGDPVIFEGAQGVSLDIDHGTYPCVTSSNTHPFNAAIGSGVGFAAVKRIVGITKAYNTRVGLGPFPTEIFDANADHLGSIGCEFGATTGRKRRCGWLDLVQLRRNVRLSDVKGLILTKLDVLSGLPLIRMAVRYSKDKLPWVEEKDASTCEYIEFESWNDDITGIKHYEELPWQCRRLVESIEQFVGIPVVMISNGPDRDRIIKRIDPWSL